MWRGAYLLGGREVMAWMPCERVGMVLVIPSDVGCGCSLVVEGTIYILHIGACVGGTTLCTGLVG